MSEPLNICRDCADGKHGACNAQTIVFDDNDDPHEVPCDCFENGHPS
jgi:hypothetical protein